MSSEFLTKYKFGSIEINGVIYSKDLILLNEEIKPNWRRKEGHNLFIVDLGVVIEFKPEILIIGTGYYGKMKVTKKLISELNFRTICLPSKEAVNRFNQELNEGTRVAGAFHLTC